MQKLIVSALFLALAGGAHAAHKCTGPDGKITYSDSMCDKDTASQVSVQTEVNTIDTSGYRAVVAKEQTQKKVAEREKEKAKEEEGHCPKFANSAPTAAEAKAHGECVSRLGK